MRSLRRVILPIVLALAVIGVTACDLLQQSEGPTLEVLSPRDFATVQLGESVDVVSTATDPRGVTRVELYVGDDLYLTDASPGPEGEKAWTLTRTWTPTAPGLYRLTVVAYNVEGEASTPWAVAIEVVEGPTTGGTPVSTTPTPTGTPQPPLPSTGTVAPPPPATSTVAPPPPPTATAPPSPPPTATPVPPIPTNTPPSMADLYVAELSIDPEAPRVGEEVQLRVVVRNAGNAPSGAFGVSAGSTVPCTLMMACMANSLPPGQEYVCVDYFTFSDSGVATITAGIGISPMDQDSNEENNWAELVVNVLPGDLPDLYIGMVSLNPSSPRVGEQVQVEVEVHNGGTANAGRHTVTWKSDPETVGCSWEVNSLAAGRTTGRTCTYAYTYPHSGQSTYTKADADGDVHESNEDNNVRYLRVNVRPAS